MPVFSVMFLKEVEVLVEAASPEEATEAARVAADAKSVLPWDTGGWDFVVSRDPVTGVRPEAAIKNEKLWPIEDGQ